MVWYVKVGKYSSRELNHLYSIYSLYISSTVVRSDLLQVTVREIRAVSLTSEFAPVHKAQTFEFGYTVMHCTAVWWINL